MEDNTAFIINRVFRRLVVPTTLSTVAAIVSTLINVLLIAHFTGASGLAVATLFIPLLTIWGCIYEGMGIGAVSVFTKNLGRGTIEEGKILVAKSNTIVLCLSVILALAGLLFSFFITAQTLGISQEQFNDAIWYARIMFISTIPMVMSNYLLFLARADSGQNISTLANTILVVLNTGLNILFLGVLDIDIQGAALSMLIASSASLIMILICFQRGKYTLKLRFMLPDGSAIRTLSRYTLNSASDNIADFLLALYINITVLVCFGLEVASIIYIINYILMFVMFWGLGIAYSTGPMLGVYSGEKNNTAIKMIARKGLVSALAVGIVLALLIAVFAKTIAVDVFNFEYEQLTAQCVAAIRWFCLSIPFYMVNVMLIHYCQQLEKFKISLLLTITSNLLLPMIFCTIAIATDVPAVIWWGFLPSYLIALLGWGVFMRIKKRREHLDSILCLPAYVSPFKVSMHFLIRPDEHHAIEDYQDMAAVFLAHHHVDASVTRRATLAMEEIIAFVEKTNQRKNGYTAIELGICKESGVRLLVKLDNEHIDIKNISKRNLYMWDDMLSLHVLQSLSTELKYQRVLSLNTFDITIEPR
ncbi:MAG: MATE family efflux transporter [Alistipes sp.]